jgi:hypothetical protein
MDRSHVRPSVATPFRKVQLACIVCLRSFIIIGHGNSTLLRLGWRRMRSVLSLPCSSLSFIAITSSPGRAENSSNDCSFGRVLLCLFLLPLDFASVDALLKRGIVLELDCSFDLKLRLTCLTQLPSVVVTWVLDMMRFRSGRKVARHPAMILAPHSIVDQMEILTEAQKKSCVSVRPST